MRTIAIIGSGQTGLLAAHGFRKAGHSVTLYSDRKPEAWLSASRPTGTAGRLALSLAYERELGLDHWEAAAPKIGGAHLTFCPEMGNRLLTLAGRLNEHGLAIDLRLQSHRWMLDLASRGGKIEIEEVTIPRLEEIAREHDLTLVATGKGGLSSLFARDEARERLRSPQRNLAMICVKGPKLGIDGIPFLPFKFNLFAPVGEAFWIPYHHKDVGPSWNCLFEAKPGGLLDRFQGAKTARETLDIARAVTKDLIPWDAPWFDDVEISDELGWLVGASRPLSVNPVGKLPSGRAVMALGDTAMAVDPIAGQGANNGNKMARNLVECAVAHEDRPFDEAWMTDTFERFWTRHGQCSAAWTSMLLEPASATAKAYLVAQYGSDGRPGRHRPRPAPRQRLRRELQRSGSPHGHLPRRRPTPRLRPPADRLLPGRRREGRPRHPPRPAPPAQPRQRTPPTPSSPRLPLSAPETATRSLVRGPAACLPPRSH